MNKKPFTSKQRKSLYIASGIILLVGFVLMFIGDDVIGSQALKIVGILIAVSPLIPLSIFWSRIVQGEKQERKTLVSKVLDIQRTACDLSLLQQTLTIQGFENTTGEISGWESESYYKERDLFAKANQLILIQHNASLRDVEKLRGTFEEHIKFNKKRETLCMAVLVMLSLDKDAEKQFLEMSKRYVHESIENEDESFSLSEDYTPPFPTTFVPVIVDREKGELVYARSEDRAGNFKRGTHIIKKMIEQKK